VFTLLRILNHPNMKALIRFMSFVVPAAYKKFRDKEDGCIKVVLKPQLG
jgi:threonine dehydrogenase-like Zn-dependent dehydrogenase